jgi:hypothetical protein
MQSTVPIIDNKEGTDSLINGKLDIHMLKNVERPLSHTSYMQKNVTQTLYPSIYIGR